MCWVAVWLPQNIYKVLRCSRLPHQVTNKSESTTMMRLVSSTRDIPPPFTKRHHRRVKYYCCIIICLHNRLLINRFGRYPLPINVSHYSGAIPTMIIIIWSSYRLSAPAKQYTYLCSQPSYPVRDGHMCTQSYLHRWSSRADYHRRCQCATGGTNRGDTFHL